MNLSVLAILYVIFNYIVHQQTLTGTQETFNFHGTLVENHWCNTIKTSVKLLNNDFYSYWKMKIQQPSASNVGARLWGTADGLMLVLALLVLTVMMLTPSLAPRSCDNTFGCLATGCSVAVATDDAGLFVDSGRSCDGRRSDDMGFSSGGFVSGGERSVLTDSWTGSDGGFEVGRGGVLHDSGFWLVAVSTHTHIVISSDYAHWGIYSGPTTSTTKLPKTYIRSY